LPFYLAGPTPNTPQGSVVRLCEQIQFGVFYQFCREIWRAFVEQAVLAGKFDTRTSGTSRCF
jgi:hypothetical protein